MDNKYLKNMTKSFANQQKSITVPTEKLGEPIFFGFQPLGIASEPKDGYDLIAIADYHAPAICLTKVKMSPKGLDFFDFEWIRGVNHGIQSVRLFPDILISSDVNRCQTVNFGQNNTLWVSRNADRNFFLLEPSKDAEKKWSLVKKVEMPENDNMIYMHAALLEHDIDSIFTIESSADLNSWKLSIYSLDAHGGIKSGSSHDIDPYTYGFGRNKTVNNSIYTVTDYRAKIHGICHFDHLVRGGIFGNGLAFLSDGSALVSVYGQSCPGPFNGMPGMLLYISKEQLEG